MNAISQINDDMSAALALDLGAELYERADIALRHGMDLDELDRLEEQPWFRNMVDTFRRDWNSVKNARERVRLKGQLASELTIPDIVKVVRDGNSPAAARVSAFKSLLELGGLGGPVGLDGNGSTVAVPQVNIYLGGDTPITIGASRRVHAIPASIGRDFAQEDEAELVEDGDPDEGDAGLGYSVTRGDIPSFRDPAQTGAWGE